MNFASTDHPTKEELQGKGIKSPSKLLSPKYLSQSSLAEQNINPSSPKCVHFINSIIILNKEDETAGEGSMKPSATECKDHDVTIEVEEEEEDDPKYFDTFPSMEELGYHEWLLKNPRPPWIMSNRLESRRKTSNPKKIRNFVGRVKGLKVFVGNFTDECDFMVLEDTTSVIDHYLASVVFGKPFVETTGLVYDKKEGTVLFEKDKEKIVFKMPHKMEMKFFIKNEEEIFTVAGDGVRIYPDGFTPPAMLYLIRKSLEVFRKFHWTILGGRFNQLSHVSSPLLSKPGEY
ncbi:hypothetical protein Tco_0950947 [Tanacetum coccineum]|uniref:Protein kinase-like domain, concanavalin A-like lectin/glucanase domain protein n=1 Tax=Tanacetum coccineum TaxID=301880 RepID=A0ABQ5DTG3_9ASTR